MQKYKKMQKNQFFLIGGKETSHFGNILFDYANSMLIVSMFKTNALFLAVYQSTETIVKLFFSLLGGVYADYKQKKKILIVTDCLNAAICLIVGLFFRLKSIAIVIIFSNMLIEIVNAFNSPVYSSIVCDAVEKKQLRKFNSLKNAVSETVKMGGAIVAAAIVGFTGTQGALLLDAATFFVSALLESAIYITDNNIGKNINENNIIKNIKDGFKYLCTEEELFKACFFNMMGNFFLAGYSLLVPYTNNLYSDKFHNFYSKVMLVEAIGGLLGSFLNSKLSIKREAKGLSIFIILTGFIIILIPVIANNNNILICISPFFGAATVVTIYNIRFLSMVQIKVSEEYLGRVFSIIDVTSMIFVPFGAFVFAKICNVENVIGYFGAGIGMIFIGFFSLFIGEKHLFVRNEE